MSNEFNETMLEKNLAELKVAINKYIPPNVVICVSGKGEVLKIINLMNEKVIFKFGRLRLVWRNNG